MEEKKKKTHKNPNNSGETWSLLGNKNVSKNENEQVSAEKKQRQIIRCPNCDEANDAKREFCWACYSLLKEPLSQNDGGVVIRKSYLFMPENHTATAREKPVSDVKKDYVEIDYNSPVEHADRIRTKSGEDVIKIVARDIQIFKGSHLIAVRIDGRNYTSEDSNVPIEARMIIRRVEAGESVQKILDEVRAASGISAKPHGKTWSLDTGNANIFKTFAENFSTIIIVGLVLIFMFLLLNLFMNY